MAKIDRRDFLTLAALGLGACRSTLGDGRRFDDLVCGSPPYESSKLSDALSTQEVTFDYVIIGSGAGGGPLAANLALAGWKVGLIEAGGTDAGPNYEVPVFHAQASEDPATRWDYFVDHYRDPALAARDPKYVRERAGILYPRAGTLGGCTAHHAMVTLYPHNSDWDGIAALLGDESWNADAMRAYFERLERCAYVAHSSTNPSRHGYGGWLPTQMTDPKLALRDLQLIKLVLAALGEASDSHIIDSPWSFLSERLRDPNDWRAVRAKSEGVFGVPLSMHHGRRAGTREYLEAVAERCASLDLLTHTLANRIVFDRDLRAVGVECTRGKRLYRADPNASDDAGTPLFVRARREVILAAGAFNSPQLLQLSGIGPRAVLEEHGIPVLLDRPGVGANLQDRYEVSVVTGMRQEFGLVSACEFRPPGPDEAADPCYAEWRASRSGVYATHGIACGIAKRSRPELPDPDLFVFGFPGLFRGYFPGYSRVLTRSKNAFTWAILKGHTGNNRGTVKLRSADPRVSPHIDFNYFDPSDETAAADRDAIVTGIEFVRAILARGGSEVAEELLPGKDVATRDELGRYVESQAWGHHASCSNKMGPASDPLAVVDTDFRVHGTRGLRIVDASVFPRIPGFFIVSAIYMIAEKATDRILADAGPAPSR